MNRRIHEQSEVLVVQEVLVESAVLLILPDSSDAVCRRRSLVRRSQPFSLSPAFFASVACHCFPSGDGESGCAPVFLELSFAENASECLVACHCDRACPQETVSHRITAAVLGTGCCLALQFAVVVGRGHTHTFAADHAGH